MLHKAKTIRKVFWLLVVLGALIVAAVNLFSVYEPVAYRSSDYLIQESRSGDLRGMGSGGERLVRNLSKSGRRHFGGVFDGESQRGEEYRFDDKTPVVRIGIYNDNNYGESLVTPSFASTGFVWMRWKEDFQRILDDNRLAPDKGLLNFPNQVESWFSLLDPVGAPRQLDNGDYYQQFMYDQNFYIDNLDLRKYPFSNLGLPIEVELNDPSDIFRFENVRLVPDLNDSGVGSHIGLDGYVMEGWRMAEFRHHYPTSFGLRDHKSQAGAEREDPTDFNYSQIIFDVDYFKSTWTGIWMAFLPLMVTLLIVVLSPSLASNLWEVRIAIPTTVLLTLVFLQQAYRSTLPELSYLTYLDEIYGLGYVVTLCSFLQFMWGSNKLSMAPEDEELQLIDRINQVDLRFQVAAVVFLVVGSIVFWLL